MPKPEALLGVHPFAIEPDLRRLMAKLQRNGAGWQSQPLPLGLAPDIVRHPEEAGHYDGFASVKGLKSDAQRILLEPLQGSPYFELLTGAPVAQLIAAGSGPRRLAGVIDQQGRRFEADTVLLAAGALHSPRLLQDYLALTGLADNLPCARNVGRYYKQHVLTALLAVTVSRQTDPLRKTVLLLNEKLPHSSDAALGFGADVIRTLFPRFVPDVIAGPIAARTYGFFCKPRTVRTSAIGCIPVEPRAVYRNWITIINAYRRPGKNTGNWCVRWAAHCSKRRIPARVPGDSADRHRPRLRHPGCRRGPDSVVDGLGKVHGLENLYVVDGSILPRIGRENPSLTIYAWALRVADYLTRLESLS
ncbi:MAG: GMC oxidoreductase [Candidatus Competibacteraceae bacterium]